MATNSKFPHATNQYDPYRNFKFRLKLDGKYVAGMSRVSGLTQVIIHRASDDATEAQPVSGQIQYGPITLERGVIHDAAFEHWVNEVWEYHRSLIDDQQGPSRNLDVSLKEYRKDIILDMFNGAGQKVMAYNIYRCWPSEFNTTPAMTTNGNIVAIQLLKLENEGWERDTTVQEPTEPSFTLPSN